MNVLLIAAKTETTIMPVIPMGLGLVAAATKQAGHQVRFLDLSAEAAPEMVLADAITLARPEAIGISIRNVDDQVSAAPRFFLEDARTVVAACRRLSRAPIILGGAGYSIFPDAALEYLGADMGIQGEGEAAFVELLARLQDNKSPLAPVPGLYLRQKGCTTPPAYHIRLDDWPFPDLKIFQPERLRDTTWYLPFQTRRGCPLGCCYCATAAIEGRHVRRRSVNTVIRELARWQEAGFNRIFFVDNTFNLPPDYAQELCRQLTAANLALSWRAIVYPCRTEESLIRTMAEAGCTEVSVGF
ncbi:MAG: radical SAM protein [Desulfocapsaceae bacterium]|nr:radical SAM protein [Desulfocapsaceae bacterium]